VPLEEIADILGMTDSGIRKVSQRVNRKIIKVL